jgi:hypothetical protein
VVPAGTTAADVAPGEYDAVSPVALAYAEPFDDRGSGLGVSLAPGSRIMVDCFYNDVASIEGTLNRVFFDVAAD